MAGVASTLSVSRRSLSAIAAGVFAGRNRPTQKLYSA
jgi:hypothetical protein